MSETETSEMVRRRSRSRRRRPSRALEVLFLLVGLAAIAAAAVGVATWLGSTVFTPEAAVERYVDAIAAGDLEAAAAELDPARSGADLIVPAEALADPADRMSVQAVTLDEIDGDRARVTVDYALAGETSTAGVTVIRGFSFFGLVGSWSVATPLLGSLVVDAPESAALVNGVEVDLPDETRAVWAYPGVYRVAASAASGYFEARDTATVTVLPGEETDTAVSGTSTASLRDAVQEAVDAQLAVCAESGRRAPHGCPFSVEIYDEYRRLSWEIRRDPVIRVTADGTGFSTRTAGKAAADFQVQTFDGRAWEDASGSSRVRPMGAVSVSDEGVEVVFDS